MSLINLLHKNVVLKFSEAAGSQFNPEVPHVFRLTGVDAMGFLQIQELKPGSPAGAETVAEPYWINKDLVLELHEFDPAKIKMTAPKTAKPKAAPKPKPVLK